MAQGNLQIAAQLCYGSIVEPSLPALVFEITFLLELSGSAARLNAAGDERNEGESYHAACQEKCLKNLGIKHKPFHIHKYLLWTRHQASQENQ